jgi:hypothetical protein
MQRNVRYQHAFGVILLVRSKLGDLPYRAIWCEQFEDLLAERNDDRFDGYQVKTSRPENGPWTLRGAELIRSIGRFCDLIAEFGDQIAGVYFVSNTECDSVGDDNQDGRRRGRCPNAFLQHVKNCSAKEELVPPYSDAFDELVAATGAEVEHLFSVLARMSIILGPSRIDLDAAIVHDHLAILPEGKGLATGQLTALFDGLIASVADASSLRVVDGMRHLFNGTAASDPTLAAKRLAVDEVVRLSIDVPRGPTFSAVAQPILALGHARETTIMERKLSHGGIEGDQIEVFRTRALATEYALMEDVERRPDRYPALQTQLEQVVLGECAEAFLRAKRGGEPFGEPMMIEVQDRLRTLADNSPTLVGHHPYESLIGIAGLLTGECRIWWSSRFNVEAA